MVLLISVQILACDRSWITHIPPAMDPVPYTAQAINMYCSKAVFEEVKKVFEDKEKKEFGEEYAVFCLELYETKYNQWDCEWAMDKDPNMWDVAVMTLLKARGPPTKKARQEPASSSSTNE